VAATAAFVCAVAVLADAPKPLRAISGLLLVLVLPGVAVVGAVTRRRPWAAEHLVLVAGSSIASVILGGLLLDRLPDGLTTDAWALALAYGTVLIVIVAALRRPARSRTPRLRPRHVARPTGRQVALFVAAVGIAAIAVGIAKASQDDAVRKTVVVQLWMLKAGRTKATTTLRIGVDAQQVPTAVYRLEVRAGTGSPTVWQVPVEGPTQWRAVVDIPRGSPQAVDVVLFAEEQPGTALRRVRQWVR
jgi:hypothetical protein